MPCQTNTLSPSCGIKIQRKHYPSGKMFVDECQVTRVNQGLFSTTMEAEKRDPGNEVERHLKLKASPGYETS